MSRVARQKPQDARSAAGPGLIESVKRISRTSVSDVRRVARRYLSDNARTIVRVLPEDGTEAAQ